MYKLGKPPYKIRKNHNRRVTHNHFNQIHRETEPSFGSMLHGIHRCGQKLLSRDNATSIDCIAFDANGNKPDIWTFILRLTAVHRARETSSQLSLSLCVFVWFLFSAPFFSIFSLLSNGYSHIHLLSIDFCYRIVHHTCYDEIG